MNNDLAEPILKRKGYVYQYTVTLTTNNYYQDFTFNVDLIEGYSPIFIDIYSVGTTRIIVSEKYFDSEERDIVKMRMINYTNLDTVDGEIRFSITYCKNGFY